MAALFLTVHQSDAIQFSDDPLLFEKELIYVGEFKKDGQTIKVSDVLIDHWVNEAAIMMAHGFKIKVPVEHTFDPEKNRGHVLSLYKKKDSKNRTALFGKIKFTSEEDAKLAKSADVSIFQPPSYEMGNGYTAQRPITHVALTDYPVVPGLDEFQTIAASFAGDNKSMTIADLAAKLGITVEDGATDDMIGEMILAKVAEMSKPEPKPPVDDTELSKLKAENEATKMQLSKIAHENRISKIDSLVDQMKITPAEAKDWKKTYASDALALSATDGFDSAFSLAKNREPYAKPGPKTKSQSLDGDKNPLLKDAKSRK